MLHGDEYRRGGVAQLENERWMGRGRTSDAPPALAEQCGHREPKGEMSYYPAGFLEHQEGAFGFWWDKCARRCLEKNSEWGFESTCCPTSQHCLCVDSAGGLRCSDRANV
ncbi:hypothetical protein PYCCODRAFT_1439030 [Trametes coccinea BRFM310]|uniref:Uncharacterized protein n=1 Tax=Trametes coccinea (strain BRFM310) TaxID=1353009 RepID=A0A1Y2IC89_TRAC3|nr:hypothetical protein PYCCODRAFT_1439030 [Trametes coccinea BRFM310]